MYNNGGEGCGALPYFQATIIHWVSLQVMEAYKWTMGGVGLKRNHY